MKPLAMLALAALAGCASAGPDYRDGPRLKPSANPSAVIAAELAFAQLAQEKGQWTALRETAADNAEMFVPERVNAQAWLKGRADPATAVKWQPHAVWSSCDGSYAVTRGAMQGPRGGGRFLTVWQRQKNGRYKWVLDAGEPSDAPLPAPEMIAARVASCSPSPLAGAPLPPLDAGFVLGQSVDATLNWATRVDSAGVRVTTVRLWNGAAYEEVINETASAPAG